jgi:YbbR domain-containing protein
MFSLNNSKFLARVAENWPAKVLSIALAIILFVFHRMSTLEDRFFSVPLSVELHASMVPSSPYTRIVRVSLRGEATSIYPILEDDIEAYIDLKQYDAPGQYRAPVLIRKKGTALGVEPLEISVDPIEVSLALDHKLSKYVSVTVNLRGNVQEGHDLVSYTLTPAQAVVDGPLSILGNISELQTDVIDLEGRNENFSLAVNILNRDPLLVIRGSGMVEFHGFIQRSVPVRNFSDLPIIPEGLGEGLSAEPDIRTGSVRLEGPQNELDIFIPPPDFLFADLGGVTAPGAVTVPVHVRLPSGLTLARQEPGEVVFTVSPAVEETP